MVVESKLLISVPNNMGSIYNLLVEKHGKVLFDTNRPFPFQRHVEETVDRREF